MMVFVSRFEDVPFPIYKARSELAISQKELDGLLVRLKYIDELSYKLRSHWIYEDVRQFIDSVELHAALCMQIGEAGEYSWWIAHTAWTEGGVNVAAAFPGRQAAIDFLSEKVPMCDDVEELYRWGERAASVNEEILVGLFATRRLEEAIGCLIALNSVVSLILSGFSRQRMLSKIW